jgi:LuxR family maltose regulon positive regulatory protein
VKATTGAQAALSQSDRPTWLGPSFEFLASKLRPPAVRTGVVARTALLDRLVGYSEPVISVVAPPGYGKSTLMAQWAERKGRRVAWVSVDRRDNDPVVLLTYIAVALDRIEPVDPRVFAALTSPGVSATATVVPRFAAALSSMTHPVVLVLDHLEVLDNQACLDAVAELAMHLPRRSQLVLMSRGAPPLPVALLRAQGQVAEIGAGELAMDRHEAKALLEGAGVGLADADVDELVRRTEGWPVGLYLAALAVKAGGPRTAVRPAFTGTTGSWPTTSGPSSWPTCHSRGWRSSPGRRCWTACPGHCATRSWPPTAPGWSWSRWRARTCWWCRWTATASGTATTICSASCSRPSSTGANPS